jgi:hypothetical protein
MMKVLTSPGLVLNSDQYLETVLIYRKGPKFGPEKRIFGHHDSACFDKLFLLKQFVAKMKIYCRNIHITSLILLRVT